jgi:GlpG protein
MRPRSSSNSEKFAWLDALPVLTTVACAACFVVFIGLKVSASELLYSQTERWGLLAPGATWEGKPWGLISSVFVHLEFFHIAFNVYWLWILGGILEQKIGSLRWLIFFLGAAWVSSALQLLTSGDVGIGMSGVGYALFGFGWVARPRMPEFARILDNQTVIIFVLWLVGCAIGTQLGLVQIANMAHLGGLAFGACVAGLFVLKWKPWATAPGLVALAALSVLPLFWCPTSFMWNALEADKARDRKDYAAAIGLYKRTLEMGEDEKWSLANLAAIYAEQKNTAEYQRTVAELDKVVGENPEKSEGSEAQSESAQSESESR